jgi:hypothetical protein
MNRNPNLKIIGYCGQSGAGKTTTIKFVGEHKKENKSTIECEGKRILGKYDILYNTGLIRSLMTENQYTTNPVDIINDNLDYNSLSPFDKRDRAGAMYKKFIYSQRQLLNDWSTEVYNMTTDTYYTPTIMQIDRSPIDFYILSVGGLNYLKNRLEIDWDDEVESVLQSIKNIATTNTNNFFNHIVVTYPWTTIEKNAKKLLDGVRDKYLTDEYVGDNWYGRIADIKLKDEIKFIEIPSDIVSLEDRAAEVSRQLIKLI